MNANHLSRRSSVDHRRRGFSVVELLVVVAIIVLLVGVLLAALSGVRNTAKKTQTTSRIDELARAVDEFQLEFQRYPGLVPWDILAANPKISGMENVLLPLMGGGVNQDTEGYANAPGVEIDFNGYKVKIDITAMGEGPVVDGSKRAPFFAPRENVLVAVSGQTGGVLGGGGGPGGGAESLPIPDLLDAWDQPMAFVSAIRTRGPLVGTPSSRPQFALTTMNPYLNSSLLGDAGANQRNLSILSKDVAGSIAAANANFAQIIRNPAFGDPDLPINGQARGRYMIISAAGDNIFFSQNDGPGSPGAGVTDISEDPGFVKQYDDIVTAGGG